VDYAEFAPLAPLAPFVRCVWTFDSTGSDESIQRIVPDGRPELVLHCAEPYAELDRRGAAHPQPHALFAGQVTRPLRLRARGRASVIGVRFHPAGARAFLGQPLRATTDARIPLDLLFPETAGTLMRDLRMASGAAERLQRVQAFVLARTAAGEAQRDRIVEAAVARIDAASGEVDVGGMAVDAGIGRRQLERRFGDAVGIGPALLAAIFRFRRVFDVLERDAARPWTDAALAAGYYDQSHFIREFRRFVGCTPTEFAQTASALSSALAQPQGDVANVQAEAKAPG
jgi:AraC-like DNA-binding protein